MELEARRVEAELAVVVAEAKRRQLFLDDGHRSMAGWLRANANLANRQIRPRLQLAALVEDLPVVIDTLAAGHIGIAQAEQLATVAANPRCGPLLANSIDVLLEQAEQLPHDDAKRCLDRWVMFADLDGAHRQRELDHERRTATVIELDGTVHASASGGTALLAAELQTIFRHFVDAEFAADAAERLEQHGANAPTALLARTDAQRRFDALVAIFRTAANAVADGSTTARPLDLVLNLICDQTTFEQQLAHDGLIPTPTDLPPTDWSQRRCETIDGTVLLPADAARAALHGHVRRVVITTAGVPVDVGRKRRLFTGVAREVARLLGHHCDHPGCTVPASQCEIDHVEEWVRDQGATDLDNAGLQCTSTTGTNNAPDSTSTATPTADPTPDDPTAPGSTPSANDNTTPKPSRHPAATTTTTPPTSHTSPTSLAHGSPHCNGRRADEDHSASATLGGVTPLADIVERISSARSQASLVFVGIGGHGASGKSTLARRIAEETRRHPDRRDGRLLERDAVRPRSTSNGRGRHPPDGRGGSLRRVGLGHQATSTRPQHRPDRGGDHRRGLCTASDVP